MSLLTTVRHFLKLYCIVFGGGAGAVIVVDIMLLIDHLIAMMGVYQFHILTTNFAVVSRVGSFVVVGYCCLNDYQIVALAVYACYESVQRVGRSGRVRDPVIVFFAK